MRNLIITIDVAISIFNPNNIIRLHVVFRQTGERNGGIITQVLIHQFSYLIKTASSSSAY
nr:MAG TPA: hypothetical protein [Caudoviricetes sp.]